MKLNFSETEFLSSAVEATDGEYDTSLYYGLAKACFGTACHNDFGDFTIYFKENIVSQHTKLNCRNLVLCKYLNIAHSSVN